MKQYPMADQPRMTLISAMSVNGLIGRGNDLPWRIPNDLKFFKATTLDGVILMGRKTFESFGGRFLPRRHHVIVTSDARPLVEAASNHDGPSLDICVSVADAITRARDSAKQRRHEQFFVIGGGRVYEQTIGLADRLILTKVHRTFEHQDGDVYFPAMGDEWNLVSSGPTEETPEGLRYTLNMVYERADI